MSANEIFRTEFRGYNKDEVAAYISSLNSQMESLQSELDMTESQLIKCRKELDSFKEVESAPRELTEDEIASIRQSIVEEMEPVLRNEIAAQLEEKYKSVIEQYVQDAKEKNGHYREKAEAYDNEREFLAELMIKAKSDAADIRDDAQKKADTLLSETFDKFMKMQADFVEMKKNVAASKIELDKRIQSMQHYLNDFSQYLDFMGRDIENTGENFKENM